MAVAGVGHLNSKAGGGDGAGGSLSGGNTVDPGRQIEAEAYLLHLHNILPLIMRAQADRHLKGNTYWRKKAASWPEAELYVRRPRSYELRCIVCIDTRGSTV